MMIVLCFWNSKLHQWHWYVLFSKKALVLCNNNYGLSQWFQGFNQLIKLIIFNAFSKETD